MRRLVLGTAGHIDHGKTTLVRALTGVDTDRLPEEKRRGITIDLGFASMRVDDELELSIVDVPGHEAFVRNMLAGATGIDLVLLVVAADEGVMPQTREHLAIVELLGVRAGVVVLAKADLVDAEWLELVVEELREALAGTVFSAAPIVPVSATTGLGLDALRGALRDVAGAVENRAVDDLFRMPIDRVFTVRGTGTVVTGTVWSGSLQGDATVRVLPGVGELRIRGLQVHGADADEVHGGMRAAVALAGADRAAIERGAVLVTDRAWTESSILTARVSVLPDAPRPLATRQRVRFHLGTREAMARLAVLEPAGEIPVGGAGWAQIRLETPVVARAGDRFVLRAFSPVETIGGGIVAEAGAGKRKRLEAEARAALDMMIGSDAGAAILAAAGLAGWAGVPQRELALRTPHSPAVIASALARLGPAVARVGERLVTAAIFEAARDAVGAAVAASHVRDPLRDGVDRAELRRSLPPDAATGLADAAIDALIQEGSVESRSGLVAARGFAPTLSAEQETARAQIVALLDEGGLSPAMVSEWPPELARRSDLRELLRRLEASGDAVFVAQELCLARAALERGAAMLREALAAGGPRSASQLREVLGVSRKYLIPLLEHFDRTGLTRRSGNDRVLAER